MKILVTGGAGFIGSHLLPRLAAAGHQVTVLDNFSTGKREHVPSGVPIIQRDLLADGLTEIFQRERFEIVIHLAAQTMVDESLRLPEKDAAENVLGTVKLLDACQRSKVKRIIIASSAAVYGNVGEQELPLSEKRAAAPLSFYGLSKFTAENYLTMYQRIFGLDYVVLRFANVYGERQGTSGEGGVVSIFSRAAARGQGVRVFGSGEQTRDFIYAGDIAEAILAALETDKVNAVYNISTAAETSVNTLIRILSRVSGRKITVQQLPVREGDILRSSLDNRAARQGLGWHPRTDIHEGLRRTYDYFLSRA